MPSTEAITYSFVRFYYSQLHEDPSKLYQIYTSDAKLTHSKTPAFTSEELALNVKKPIETETLSTGAEITEFYRDLNLKDAKIRISYVDSQSILNEKSILVNVMGELALTDESPVFRFNQSFILTPGRVKDSYDIANDIFRLFPDDYFETGASTEKESETTDEVEETPNVVEEKSKEEIKSEPKQEQPVPEVKSQKPKEVLKEKTPEVIEPPKEKPTTEQQHTKAKSSKSPKQDTKPHPKKESKSPKQDSKPKPEPKEESKSKIDESPKPSSKVEISEDQKDEQKELSASSASSASAPSLSWADQVLSTPDKPFTVSKAKPASKPKDGPKSPQQDTTQQQQQQSQQSKPAANGTSTNGTSSTPSSTTASSTQKPAPKKKTEYLYPVYVHGTGQLNNGEIRIEFEKEFGKTSKVEPRGHFALVNFETAESRQKALKRKTFTIKEHTVKIEEMKEGIDFKKPTPNSAKSNVKSNQRQSNTSGNKKRPTTKQNS